MTVLKVQPGNYFSSDSTDLVMKANGQPQLRLGADGTTEVMQQLRMSALEELVADTSQAEPRVLVLRGDGSVVAAPPPPGGFLHWWADKYNATCWNNHGTVALEVMGAWSYDFSYHGGRTHREGRGFLGFDKVVRKNMLYDRLTEVTASLNQDYFIRYPSSKTITTIGGQPISSESKTYAAIDRGNGRFWNRPSTWQSSDALKGFNSSGYWGYDNDGNVNLSYSDNGAESVGSIMTYTSFGSWPFASRILHSETTVYGESNNLLTKKDYSYDSNGFMLSEITNQATQRETSITYEPGPFGNVNKAISAGNNIATTQEEYEYETKGRFVTKIINTLGQESFASYDHRWGKPTSILDIDGHSTSFEYNGFGLVTTATDILGITSTINYHWDNGTPGALCYTEETSPGASTEKTWYDLLGREVKYETVGFSGTVASSTVYNALGQMDSSVDPNGVQTTYGYDPHHRLNSISNSDGVTSLVYSPDGGNFKTSITSPEGVSHRWEDASGKLKKTQDEGGTLVHSHDASGGVLSTTIQGQQNPQVIIGYDPWGYQESLDDLNSGHSEYEYSTDGNLLRQEVNGYELIMTYDNVGRILTKSGPTVQYDQGVVNVDANFRPVPQNGTTTFEYVTSGNGLNELKKITAPNGISSEYAYDEFGRIISETETIDSREFTTAYTYDALGRVATETLPSGVTITNEYTSNGHLSKVVANGTDVFTSVDANAMNQITEYTLGNGVAVSRDYNNLGRPTDIYTDDEVFNYFTTFDAGTGNLDVRSDVTRNLEEDFDYDALNRLTDSDVNGSPSEQHVDYDNNGNITFKSDAGTYDYWQNKPNAVKSITNLVGNDPQDISLVTQNVAYTTEGNQVAMIEEEPYRAIFTYGTDNQRKKMVLQKLNTTSEEYDTYSTRYYHGAYEELELWNEGDQSFHTYQLTYIVGGDGLCAVHVITDNDQGELYYTYKDYLGSILVLTDDDGAVVGEQSFDAWGRYRDPDTWEVHGSTPSEGGVFNPEVIDMPAWFSRGYTGHEHLPEFDLINMNGRLYDPIPARMLSADNFVQAPGYSQSYNRYAYVFNNPLKYVDPTGNMGEDYFFGGGYDPDYVEEPAAYLLEEMEDGPGDGKRKIPRNRLIERETQDVVFDEFIDGQSYTGSDQIYDVYSAFENPVPGYVNPGRAGMGSINMNGVERAYQHEYGFWDNSFNKIPELSFEIPSPTLEGGLSKDYIAGTIWDVTVAGGKKSYTVVNNEMIRQINYNNKIRKPGTPKNAVSSLKIPKGLKIIGKYGGSVFTVYGIYDVDQQWRNNEINTRSMLIEQVSNGIGVIPVFGTGWSFGWGLGKSYGPSKWYGENNNKWFE